MLESDSFRCQYCDKCFAYNKSLLRHVRNDHKGLPGPDHRSRGRRPKKTTEQFPCTQCGKIFGARRNLREHVSYTHRSQTAFPNLPKVKKALSTEMKSEKEFNSYIEFLQWKLEEEDITSSRFVKKASDVVGKSGIILRRFYCHRSGKFKSRGHGVRNLKVQGSCKIGKNCPASMLVRIQTNGRVFVTYFPTHKNHHCEVAHLNLRREERQHIAGMLLEGVPVDSVLEKMQKKCGTEKVSHLHLITNKHIQNIARDFNISKSSIIRTKDSDSVSTWMGQNLQLDGDNSVAAEEIVADVSCTAPQNNEVAEILCDLPKHSNDPEIQNYIDTTLHYFSNILSRMGANVKLAGTVCEMLGRVNAFVCDPETEQPLPELKESISEGLINKNPGKRTVFLLAPKQSRHRAEILVRKQTLAEQTHLGDSLCSSGEIIYESHVSAEHDYNAVPSNVVNF